MAGSTTPGTETQKKSLVASEQRSPRVQALRRVFLLLMLLLDPRRLVFLDETGCHTSMTRTHGRAPRGERVVGYVPRVRGAVTTVLGALALDGIRAMMTIEGATTADVFEAFVEHMLVPKLNPGDIVVMDNVGAHKPAHILERIRAAGAHVLFLPPYSPDLNPIELLWSKLKELLKSMGARTLQALDDAIARAMDLITPDDIAGWFRHCGYTI
ncbi:IS630 family transposase [Archangium violaceum]|uniref:IS630 family transposase n=1 Tax=Archangium violaceum TaxID=83451 RepID=UPI0037C188AC